MMTDQDDRSTITLELPREVAQAYSQASPCKQRHIKRLIAYHLLSHEDSKEQLVDILDRIGSRAAQRGLTGSRLQSILQD